MGKLQLYMTMSRGDFAHKVDVNAVEDVKQWVCDLTEAVRQVDYNPKRKSIFYMVKYIDTGAFIVVIRTIPREHGHHLASWIYVPYSLKISDAEVYRLVDFIAGIVSNDAIGNKEIEAIRREFGNVYPDDPLAPQFAPNEGSAYCYRYYGANTGDALGELIGRYRYQISYLPYAGTLLVDHDITSNISGYNLTSAPKDEMVTLLPPLDGVIDGYKPTIFGEKFDVPFFVPYQRTIEVIWHQPGVPDKRVPVCPSLPEMRCPGLESASPSQVIEVRTQTVAQKAMEEEPFHDAEAVEEQAPVQSQPAYWEEVPEEKSHVVAQPVEDPEEKKASPTRENIYNFEMPTTVGGMAEFTLHTGQIIEDSPIEGYEAAIVREGAGHVNRLYFKDDRTLMTALKQKGPWALGGLIVGIVATLLFTCARGGDAPVPAIPADTISQAVDTVNDVAEQVNLASEQPVEQVSVPAAQPVAETPQAAQPDAASVAVSAKAIEYLDNNSVWSKAELDKFPELSGLYDDLNNVNRSRILNHWGPKLTASTTFTGRIVKHTKQGERKKAKKVPYSTNGKIGVQGWLNNVDP